MTHRNHVSGPKDLDLISALCLYRSGASDEIIDVSSDRASVNSVDRVSHSSGAFGYCCSDSSDMSNNSFQMQFVFRLIVCYGFGFKRRVDLTWNRTWLME